MKVSFKPLSLAVAVSAATAGYAGSINATVGLADNSALGDAAIVPYYTVRADWTTGVSIINTSAHTQVVKVRLRRATDSMDVLDFNIVMSPEDVWTGYLENNTAPGVEDQLRFYSDDNSCTVPAMTANADGVPYFAVPKVFSAFAEEGYLEVIGMGSMVTEKQPFALFAKHGSNGKPANCEALQANFQRYGTKNTYNAGLAAEYTKDPISGLQNVSTGNTGTSTDNGVVNSNQTVAGGFLADFTAPGNFMKVSWFIKDTTSGIEMGDNAVMLSDLMTGASMTSQIGQDLLTGEDLQGYDYPDLNGGAPLAAGLTTSSSINLPAGTATVCTAITGLPVAPSAATAVPPNSCNVVLKAADTGQYNGIRDVLGARSMINDWSKNVQDDLSVDTDWVITVPGQYTMLDLPTYIKSLSPAGLITDPAATGKFDPASIVANAGCVTGTSASFPVVPVTDPVTAQGCDFRDLPLTLVPVVYDREEAREVVPDDQIVISPTPPGPTTTTKLYYEVNVIQWGDSPVLDAAASTDIQIELGGAVSGWADLSVTSQPNAQAVCSYAPLPATTGTGGTADGTVNSNPLTCTATTSFSEAPVVGFAAWQRSFTTNPDANYGRAIRPSFLSSDAG